ncbi:MAG: multidrug efflux RND transporter permease subunit, partial [Proteobacteria bacterium]
FSGVPDTAELELKLDREKAEAMGVSVAEINATLGIMFGSDYIGDFVLNSQVRKIIVQAEGVNRLAVQDVGKLYVRGASGEMVPLSSFVTMKWTVGPPQLSRFNGFPSMSISGSPPPGKSSGDAMSAMEAIVKKLPTGTGFEWAAQSAEELESSRQAPILYALSLLIVFLALAALYESWTIPIAVLLVVPLGILGAVFGVTVRGLPNDIYFRVGLIATIGLSAKNAILIVEVAKDLHEDGKELYAATIEAAKLRLRPIIMTSLAFGVGVIPLVLSSGAGSGAQTAIGTGVLGGIIFATVLAIFLVPMFFVLVMRYLEVHLASGKHIDKENDDSKVEEASR